VVFHCFGKAIFLRVKICLNPFFCIKFLFLIHVSVQDKKAGVFFPAVYISGVHFSMGIGAEFTERSRNDEHSEDRENEVYRSEQAVIGQPPMFI
jgi:hypothetical protein